MCPHYKLTGLLIKDDFRTFQHFGRMQVMIRIVFDCRKHNSFKFPIQQVFRRVTTDSGHVCTITLPRSPVRQNRFPFLVFAIPIVSTIVIKKSATMSVYRISIGIFPHLSGGKVRILLSLYGYWKQAYASYKQ